MLSSINFFSSSVAQLIMACLAKSGGIFWPVCKLTEPTTFSGVLYQESQKTIAQLKQYMCENVGVWLIDENGNIGCLVDDMDEPTKYMPIPIGKMFVGDKKLGGFEEPDSNTIEWAFFPNWSDNLYIIKRESLDFNPLTEWVNVASSQS